MTTTTLDQNMTVEETERISFVTNPSVAIAYVAGIKGYEAGSVYGSIYLRGICIISPKRLKDKNADFLERLARRDNLVECIGEISHDKEDELLSESRDREYTRRPSRIRDSNIWEVMIYGRNNIKIMRDIVDSVLSFYNVKANIKLECESSMLEREYCFSKVK